MTYRAVIRNGAAVLPADAQIAEGAEVEVVVPSRGTPPNELLHHSGRWHGDDADEIVEIINQPRGGLKSDSLLCKVSGLSTGAVACILCVYSAYLAFYRLVAFKNVFKDFAMPLPAATVFVLNYPWVPLALSLVAMVIAGLSVARASRTLMVLACVWIVVAAASIAFSHIAVEMPMIRLVQSVSGG